MTHPRSQDLPSLPPLSLKRRKTEKERSQVRGCMLAKYYSFLRLFSRKFLTPGNPLQNLNLMITELYYWHIPTIYELRFSSMQAYSPLCFRYRFIIKNFFAGFKSFWGFRETGPFRENGTSTLFWHGKLFYQTIVITKRDCTDIFKLASLQSMIYWLGPSDISRCCQISHQAKASYSFFA